MLVYCDAHASLIKICDSFSLQRRHPPPGRPQANSVIERQIGEALQGLRAYLVSAGLPNCFWPFAGHCYSVNACQTSGAYERAYGEVMPTTFVFGQLVFYNPAPTIKSHKQAKTDQRLRPGIFLDYYIDYRGKFSGQYIYAAT